MQEGTRLLRAFSTWVILSSSQKRENKILLYPVNSDTYWWLKVDGGTENLIRLQIRNVATSVEDKRERTFINGNFLQRKQRKTPDVELETAAI